MNPGQPRAFRAGDAWSWAVGRYAVLELLERRPGLATDVRWHDGIAGDDLSAIRTAAEAAGVPIRRADADVARVRRKGDAHVVARFDAAGLERDLDPDADHLVWIAPDHFGNVGTTMRTMLAFGVADLALVGPRLAPAHPHVVRASIGAVFGLRVRRFADLAAYRATVDRPLHTVHPSGSTELSAATFDDPCSLVLGPERSPRPEDALPEANRIRIEQDPGVESLNVAVAAGIVLHALRRRRRTPTG